MLKGISTILFALLVFGAQADKFGTGTNHFSMDFVGIDSPGNPSQIRTVRFPDGRTVPVLIGGVRYRYRMGKREVTIEQFAKARAADSSISNGDEGYWNDPTRLPMSAPHPVGKDAPAVQVSWFEAARFANWLTSGSAANGAYKFDTDGSLLEIDRSGAMDTYGTVYILPTSHEWHKAAYYNPIHDGSYSLYTSGRDTLPLEGEGGWNYNTVLGSPWASGSSAVEQNGTHDMLGNVGEYIETTIVPLGFAQDDDRSVWFGHTFNIASPLSTEGVAFFQSIPRFGSMDVGFRVASIPEPSSAMLCVTGAVWLLWVRRAYRFRFLYQQEHFTLASLFSPWERPRQ